MARRTAELEQLNAELRAEAAERADAEQRLRQAQKMEAVGQLTGGIAHDFNNMLSIIVGGIELAKRKLSDDHASLRHLDTASEGAERAADLTRRLLAFARAEPLVPESTDVAKLVHGMADLMQRTLGERIRVTIEAGDDAGRIWVDPRQLENAILNLAVNARDAMNGEGDIGIEIGNVTLGEREIGNLEAGDYLRIAVTDTGTGMSDEVLERVFEPFFTTKPTGEGTGLGLSQIFGFTRQSDGDVGIESSVGVGSTVSLYLPVYESAENLMRDGNPAPQKHAYGPLLRGACVILVEDDPRVRAATTDALAELGAEPVACENGAAAMDALARKSDARLVLSDIVMPDMTGVELAEKLTVAHPDIPVVFMTGYTGAAGSMEKLAGRDILRKPFTMEELADSICAALDNNDETGIAAE